MYAHPAERNAQPFPRAAVALSSQGAAPHDLLPLGEHRGLLASPAFWVGGAASVLCWTGLAMVLLRWF